VAGQVNRLEPASDWLVSGGSVLLYGPSGVGKSGELESLAWAARRATVLACTPGPDDAAEPFRTLAWLLSSSSEVDVPLPGAEREVLRRLREGATDALQPPLVRIAVLDLFRRAARARPLLLVVDDLQWVDDASAAVLRFVAPRVYDVAVRMAATERVPSDSLPLRRDLCPSPLMVVRLDGQREHAG